MKNEGKLSKIKNIFYNISFWFLLIFFIVAIFLSKTQMDRAINLLFLLNVINIDSINSIEKRLDK